MNTFFLTKSLFITLSARLIAIFNTINRKHQHVFAKIFP
jgi:hypothetical protein